MSFWSAVHWHEGMLMRPHHLQAERRSLETLLFQQLRVTRPFAWGVLEMKVSEPALENFIFRLDECRLMLKDGTWVCIPDNASVAELNIQKELESAASVEVLFGIPSYNEARANAISLTNPQMTRDNPRFDSKPHDLRDENTGENRQQLRLRRLRGRLFTNADEAIGYDTIRLGAVRRSDKVGAIPEFVPELVGPALAIQGVPALNRLFAVLVDQIEGKGDVLAAEALESRMGFGDGVSSNVEHLMKVHTVNCVRTRLRALSAAPLLHPYDAFVELMTVAGWLSIFDSTTIKPDVVPIYDHDQPGVALSAARDRIVFLLDSLRPVNYALAPFARSKNADGREDLAVELKPSWLADQCDMYIALESGEFDSSEALLKHIYSKFDMKLASPRRAPRLDTQGIRGLTLRVKTVRPGTLPRRSGLHYFWIDRTTTSGVAAVDYWRECENERGIWLTTREGQREEIEKFRPSLYVITAKK